MLGSAHTHTHNGRQVGGRASERGLGGCLHVQCSLARKYHQATQQNQELAMCIRLAPTAASAQHMSARVACWQRAQKIAHLVLLTHELFLRLLELRIRLLLRLGEFHLAAAAAAATTKRHRVATRGGRTWETQLHPRVDSTSLAGRKWSPTKAELAARASRVGGCI